METRNVNIFHCITCGRVMYAELGAEAPQCCGHAMALACEDTLHEGELAGTINGYIEVELAFSGLDLGDVDVEIADRISLELFLRRFATLDFRQSADTVTLKAAMQG